MTTIITSPRCVDTRKCFGAFFKNEIRLCRILTETYTKDGACRFCKPEQEDVPNAQFVRYVEEHGIKYRDIADLMGVSAEHLHKLLSEPLSPKSESRIKKAIRELEGNA